MHDKIFISYSQADSDFAIQLDRDLDAAGFDCFLAENDIPPGKPWDETIQKALKDSTTVLVILSPTSVLAQGVLDEIGYAIHAGKRIIPVRYKLCEVPLRINRLQRIDFMTGYAVGLSHLIATLKGDQPSDQKEPRPRSPGTDTVEQERPYIAGDKSTKMRAIYAAMAILALVGVSLLFWYSFTSNPKTPPLRIHQSSLDPSHNEQWNRFRNVQWNQIQFDSQLLDSCLGYPPCVTRQKLRDQIKLTTWSQIKFDDPLLLDCMAYEPCVVRQNRETLLRHTIWRLVKPSEPLLADCMGYEPCLTAKRNAERLPLPPIACVPESLPDCCRDSPNPDACRKCKKTADLRDHCSV